MPIFVYRAVTDKGVIVRNRVEEVSRKSLIKKLKRNNLTPINIVQVRRIVAKSKQKQKKNINNVKDVIKGIDTNNYMNVGISNDKKTLSQKLGIKINRKINNRDLVIFTQDLYLLKKAEFNNIHALSTIIETTENPHLKEIIADILAGVEAGESMYSTMEYYSDVFPYLYINMIKVGEQSGSLTTSLQEAVTYLDETEKFDKKIKSILLPNILMLAAIIVLIFAGTLVVIPLIEKLYMSMGSEQKLPEATIVASNIIKWFLKHWYLVVLGVAGIAYAFISYIRTPKGRYKFDYFKYTMPLFGKLIFSLDFTRFARAMLLNLSNGIRIQDSLETSKNVIKNSVLRSIIESSINDIIIGQSWIDAFEKSRLPSAMIIEMLNIGMSTDLKEMMGKLLEYLQSDIDNSIAKIIKALPNIVYTVVGVALVIVVIVVLVPCIDAYMGGWMFSAAGL